MESGVKDRGILSDSRLNRFSPSERRAILVHKYFLGIQLGGDPDLATAIADWERRYAQAWRESKMRADLEAQIREIERHKYHLSERAGRDVGWEFAIGDWMKNHAGAWREWWEDRPDSGA